MSRTFVQPVLDGLLRIGLVVATDANPEFLVGKPVRAAW